MNTLSAEWSFCPCSGTRLYMEMPQGWTGEGDKGLTPKRPDTHVVILKIAPDWMETLDLLSYFKLTLFVTCKSFIITQRWVNRTFFGHCHYMLETIGASVHQTSLQDLSRLISCSSLQEDKEDHFAQHRAFTSLYQRDLVRCAFLQQSHLLPDHHGHCCSGD